MSLEEIQERLELAIAGTSDGLWEWDLETGDVWCAPRFAELLGYGPAEFSDCYESWQLRVHPDDRERTQEALRVHLESARPYDVEHRLCTKSGRYRWFRVRGRARRDASGKAIRMGGSIQDIEDLKQGREELACQSATDARMNMLQALNAASVAVTSGHSFDEVMQLVADRARGIVGANQAITRFRVDEDGGEPITRASLADQSSPCRARVPLLDRSNLYEKVYRDNLAYRMTREQLQAYLRIQGLEEDPNELSPMAGLLIVPLIGREGHNLGLIQVSEKGGGEFTEEDQAMLTQFAQIAAYALDLHRTNEQLENHVRCRTAELAALNVELARSNRELNDFAYAASHDLQEPLRCVSRFCELLQLEYRGKFDPTADRWMENIVCGTTRMQNMIRDLLRYSQVESCGQPFHSVDVAQVFDEVLDILSEAIAESGAQLTCGQLPTVIADRWQIIQLLVNLAGNAIKYRGEAPPEIRLTAQRQVDNWQFAISDNGIGIDLQHQDRIFEMFKRLHGRGEYPGNGIGLALCRRIIERHRGRIWVDSELGKGSTFHFLLPALPEEGCEKPSNVEAGCRG